VTESLRQGLDGWIDESVALDSVWNVDPTRVSTNVTWQHDERDRNAPFEAARRLCSLANGRFVEWRSAAARMMAPMNRSGRAVGAAVALAAGAVVGSRVGQGLRRRRSAIAAVAPELRSPLLYVPFHVTAAGVRMSRRLPPPPARLTGSAQVEQVVVPGAAGEPQVDLYLYKPSDRPTPSGALLWIHGGGYVIGHPAAYHALCSRLAADAGVLVASVDYRLAPEHPFPAGLTDCYAALRWLHEHAEELGLDPARIAVGGDSAGGGLAAALAQLAHDRAEVPVRFQLLVYPMLDDRTVLRADDVGTGQFVWSRRSNRFGWTAYLGHEPTAASAPEYAAPARRADLRGLPPAWIGVGALDLFHAEDLAYAARLQESGVDCDLHEVPGMYHGADVLHAYRTPLAAEFLERMTRAVRGAVGP